VAAVWLQNHMLGGHLPSEAIELIVASIFARTEVRESLVAGAVWVCGSLMMRSACGWWCVQAPGSLLKGFLAFLSLMATFDWKGTPMVVDPEGQLSGQSPPTRGLHGMSWLAGAAEEWSGE
jgi:hypothetical protein